jgi:hypothetical protein
VIEATAEAIYGAPCMAAAVTRQRGLTVETLPLARVAELAKAHASQAGL